MNKKLIALAVAAFASASASAAEVYNDDTSSLVIGGRAEARASVVDGDVSDKSRARFNVTGKTEIAEGTYGIGFFENEFSSNTSDEDEGATDVRHVYAGIGGDFGQIVYGKTDGSMGVITDFTDIMSYGGNNAASKLTIADRANNNMVYSADFGNLSVKANAIMNDQDADTTSARGYSASAIYAFDNGLALGLGAADQEVKASKVKTDSTDIQFAASYTFGDIYVAGLYKTQEDKTGSTKVDTDGYEFAAAYKLNDNVKFTSTYNNQEADNVEVQNNLNVDATYYFNANFRTYAAYKFNMLSEDTANGITKAKTEDEFAVGLRYDF